MTEIDSRNQKVQPKDLTKAPKDVSNEQLKHLKKEELKEMQKRDRTMVRGKFIFHEVPGGSMGFMFKKYKGDPLEKFEMVDGQIYTIPLGVAKHLNTNCAYPSYNYKNDEAGRPVVSVAEKIRRCSFQSLEFVDVSSGESVGSALPS